jgi:hypothetical protein
MADKKQWVMSDTQKSFLELVKGSADGITFREAKKEMPNLTTGAINTLITKGYVSTDGPTRDFQADIVYNGEVIGHKTYNDKVYRLVAQE